MSGAMMGNIPDLRGDRPTGATPRDPHGLSHMPCPRPHLYFLYQEGESSSPVFVVLDVEAVGEDVLSFSESVSSSDFIQPGALVETT
mmetsp:Transcript_32071/g.52998  ORF Transcript_32071/g.52998 Transcript_32071/m.52998 type:complete len:87 (+) Transcript_32071:492-752(+)